VGIALVLASVFVPTAVHSGITGRLYQQFAMTIAISVIALRVQCAQTLSRRSRVYCCGQNQEEGNLQAPADLSGNSFDVSNRYWESSTNVLSLVARGNHKARSCWCCWAGFRSGARFSWQPAALQFYAG